MSPLLLRHGVRIRLLAVVTAFGSALASSRVLAADSLAPRGASASWLPNAPWVLERWLPYREGDLLHILHTDQTFLGHWLTDHRGLDDLVRVRHLNLQAVESQLVAPWRGQVSRRQLRVLLARTDLTFTQHHLAVHMFFHFYHLAEVNGVLPALLGVGFRQMDRLESAGLSLMDIAVRDGHTPSHVMARLRRVLRRAAMEGIREHAVLPDQELGWLRFDDFARRSWLTWRVPAARPASGRQSTRGLGAGRPGDHLFCAV